MTDKEFISKAISLLKNEKAALNICKYYDKTYDELCQALLIRIQKFGGKNARMRIHFTDTMTGETISHIEYLSKLQNKTK